MSNEMIERVAKAIQDCPFPATNEDKAKAAIAAMRETNKEMIIDMQTAKVKFPDSLAAIWEAGIDAALKE